MADHPHSRGDNCFVEVGPVFGAGPSPLAWGQPGGDFTDNIMQRTIPTRVGTTTVCWGCARGRTDHPHSRGDNSALGAAVRWFGGPSPLAWGQRVAVVEVHLLVRTIPTRVGTTAPGTAAAPRSSDHPHSRGDNGKTIWRGHAIGGPSPLAWGQLPARNRQNASPRTIPTRVGTTELPLLKENSETDHPHSRGDNASSSAVRKACAGPSPLAWGQPGGGVAVPAG